MPDLNCLNKEVADIKNVLNEHAVKFYTLDAKLDKNTEITEGIKADTVEIVDLMKWGKSTRKIILWTGSLLAGIWAIVEGLRHFK
jgi:hypothetical protein